MFFNRSSARFGRCDSSKALATMRQTSCWFFSTSLNGLPMSDGRALQTQNLVRDVVHHRDRAVARHREHAVPQAPDEVAEESVGRDTVAVRVRTSSATDAARRVVCGVRDASFGQTCRIRANPEPCFGFNIVIAPTIAAKLFPCLNLQPLR